MLRQPSPFVRILLSVDGRVSGICTIFVNQYSSFFVVDVLLLGILMLPIVNFGAADADAKFPKTPFKCKCVC